MKIVGNFHEHINNWGASVFIHMDMLLNFYELVEILIFPSEKVTVDRASQAELAISARIGIAFQPKAMILRG